MNDKETFDHKVSSQDLQNNPELAQAGVQESEIIGIPVEDTAPPVEVPGVAEGGE